LAMRGQREGFHGHEDKKKKKPKKPFAPKAGHPRRWKYRGTKKKNFLWGKNNKGKKHRTRKREARHDFKG